MELLSQRLARQDGDQVQGRLNALEDYVEYLRQQTQYGLDQAAIRLERLEQKS